MTFSIVAYDPAEAAFGVAVASKFLAVGAVVPWAQAGVGAVATQALANVTYGPHGLRAMSDGLNARAALERLLADDPIREQRQVGLVDVQGGSASHTGRECFDYASHRNGEGYAIQGNILAGAAVLDAMVEAYQAATGVLSERLLAALNAGDAAGGDRRGRQSAAIKVVKPNGGYGGDNDLYLDLRVDDADNPFPKLADLLQLHHLFFDRPNADDLIPITENIARELQTMMQAHGYYRGEITGAWDEAAKAAFWALVGNENLEERWHIEQHPELIDRVALDYLRGRLGA